MDADELPRVPFGPGWKDDVSELRAVLFTACAIGYIIKKVKEWGTCDFTAGREMGALGSLSELQQLPTEKPLLPASSRRLPLRDLLCAGGTGGPLQEA